MTFTPNIPAVGQSLGNSRPQVLNNFAVLRSTIAENHFDVNDADAGKHGTAIFPEVGNPSFPNPPTTAANEGALYTKDSGGTTQLFWRQESNGGEFGHAYIKGQVALPAGPTTQVLKDFTGYPDCYGLLEARVNASLGVFRQLLGIYVVGGFYNAFIFNSATTGLPQGNLGSQTGSGIVFSPITPPQLVFIALTGFGAPATLNWTFTHTIFPST